MNKTFKSIAVATALLISATGCNILKQTETIAPEEQVETPQEDKAEEKTQNKSTNTTEKNMLQALYGEWTAFNVDSVAVIGNDGPIIILEKSTDGSDQINCYANNGCNSLNGSFIVTKDGKMTPTTRFISTMRYCNDAKYETGFNNAISQVSRYTIEKVGSEYLLIMKDEAGSTLMSLRRADTDFLEGAWTVTKVADKNISADKGLKLAFDITNLKVHGNTGCNVLNGTLFFDHNSQNSLQLKDIATTRMSCQDMELEQLFLATLEKVTTVNQSGKESIQLKDAQGNTIITLKRLKL